MGVVTVTGNAWTQGGVPIPEPLRPELWFRPVNPEASDGTLLVNAEVKATLNPVTGAFTVSLFAAPALRYRPVMRWLSNPLEQKPQNWAWGENEWRLDFNPYPLGGDLSDLIDLPDITAHTVRVCLDDPGPAYRGWWLSAPGPGYWTGDPSDPASSGTGILTLRR